jgi:hypothetical protein
MERFRGKSDLKMKIFKSLRRESILRLVAIISVRDIKHREMRLGEVAILLLLVVGYMERQTPWLAQFNTNEKVGRPMKLDWKAD